MSDRQIATEVEQLMARIQHRVDSQPHFRTLLDAIDVCRGHADGISESTCFNKGLISGAKGFIYKCLMRVFKTNFERQRLFNHSLVDTLELLAENVNKLQLTSAEKNGEECAGALR